MEYAALCAYNVADYSLSLQCHKKALSLNERLIGPRISKGLLEYQVNGKIDKDELNLITKLLLKRKERMQGRVRLLARIYYSLGQYQKAETVYQWIEKKNIIDQFYFYQSQIKQGKIIDKKLEDIALIETFTPTKEKENKTLNVILSQSSDKNLLTSYTFKGDRLDFRDMTVSYYILTHQMIYQKISQYVEKYQYKKVNLVSISKGGLGLMNIFSNLQQSHPHLTINAWLGSGFVRLYPLNGDIIKVPSYRKTYEYLTFFPEMLDELKIMQQKAFMLKVKEGNKFTYCYGNRSKVDIREGEFLKYSPTNIKVIDFDYSGHSIGVPLCIPQGKDRAWLEEKYATIKVDNDLQAIDPSLLNFVDEIETIYKTGITLNDFL